MTGISFEFKDKNVDKMLSKRGFINSEIYYSPIKVWFIFWGFLAIPAFPVILGFAYDLLLLLTTPKVLIFILIYGLMCYLIISILNRNFAITDKSLLVINAHFPFRKFQQFKFENIKKVRIAADRKWMFLLFFGIFQSHFIEIETTTQKKKFYCLFLDVDCYDENWTKRTLDDLDTSLKSKRINVKLEI